MESSGSSPEGLVRGRPLRLVALLAMIAAVVIGVILLTGDDDNDSGGGGGTTTVTGPAGNEFTLQIPDGWSEVAADQRDALPGDPLMVVQRDEQKGLVVVNVQQGKVNNFDKQVKTLDSRLGKAIPDFKKVGARIVDVKAGKALLYSYAREERGTAHSLLVVPHGDRSYSLNGAVPAGENDAAREMGAILLSFDL
jgi:hypothetical protein